MVANSDFKLNCRAGEETALVNSVKSDPDDPVPQVPPMHLVSPSCPRVTPWLRVLGVVVDLSDDSSAPITTAATASGDANHCQAVTPFTETFAYDSDVHDSESEGLLVLHAFVGSAHVLALVDSGALDNIVTKEVYTYVF